MAVSKLLAGTLAMLQSVDCSYTFLVNPMPKTVFDSVFPCFLLLVTFACMFS